MPSASVALTVNDFVVGVVVAKSVIEIFPDVLLDVKEIRNYLSMVAPVPFSNKFIYRSEIYNELKKDKLTIDEYRLFINTEQLEKGYTTYIWKGEENNKEKAGEVIGVEFFKDYDKHGNLLFLGWYSLTTSLNEQMRSVNRARGFRLRKSNIQVGNEFTLEKLHREQRGNFYFFGEGELFLYSSVYVDHKSFEELAGLVEYISNCLLYECIIGEGPGLGIRQGYIHIYFKRITKYVLLRVEAVGCVDLYSVKRDCEHVFLS